MANINLSGISQAVNSALSLGNLVLVSPQSTIGYQPQNFPSWKRDTSQLPPALLFNYEGEQTVSLTSDITDHYIEDNTAVQDQIARKPVMVTTHGFIGELNDIAPAALEPLKIIAEKLTTIPGYVPQLSTSALIAYNQAQQAYNRAVSLKNAAVGVWSSINGSTNQSVINGSSFTKGENQTKQQVYFQQFYGYWAANSLFTVQTPWAVFQDMAIQTLRAIQDAETNMISDFEITFKQLRFASTLSTDRVAHTNNLNFQSRLIAQGASVTNIGASALEVSTKTFSSAVGF